MKEVFDAAVSVVKKLQDAGHTTYFAGGWVRDFLMDHPSDDIDIATTASVQQMEALFEKTIPVGIAFGILIIVEKGHHFEVATFRTERGYVDGRRPSEVTPATPEEDALRRDFTINGMYYDPLSDELIDYVEGKKDVKRKILKAIGDPNERFKEDRLRMIRAVRYSARFSFSIEDDTWNAIKKHAHLLFPSVAIERVWNEFTKMSKYGNFDIALTMLQRLGLLDTIFPEYDSVVLDELQKRVAPIRNCPKNTPTILLLMHLFPNHTLEEQRKIGMYLKISKKEIKHIEDYTTTRKVLLSESPTPYHLVCALAHPDSSLYLSVFAASLDIEKHAEFLQKFDELKKKYASSIDRIQKKIPLISADEFIALGVPKGPQLGKLIQHADELAVNESLSKEDVLKKLGY